MAHESPQEVERRIERDREDIDATIHAIQERFSPGQLFDQAMGYMRSNGSDVATHFGRAVKENPFPLLLTGVGLAWLISSSSRADGRGDHAYPGYDERSGMNLNGSEPAIARAREAAAGLQRRADETAETFQDRLTEAKAKALELQRRAEETAADFKARVDSMMSSASSAAHHARDRARHTRDQARLRARHASDAAVDMADRARHRAVSLFEEQPLIAIAAGIGIGTLLGALMPSTRMEDEALGEYGQAAKRQLRHAAEDVGHRAERVAADTAQAAAQSLDHSLRHEAGDSATRHETGTH